MGGNGELLNVIRGMPINLIRYPIMSITNCQKKNSFCYSKKGYTGGCPPTFQKGVDHLWPKVRIKRKTLRNCPKCLKKIKKQQNGIKKPIKTLQDWAPTNILWGILFLGMPCPTELSSSHLNF
jgi:hypothetical protein